MMKKPKLNPVQRDLLKKINRLERRLSAKKREDYSRTDLVDAYACLLFIGAEVGIERNPFTLERFLKVAACIKQLIQDRRNACISELWEKAHDPEFVGKVLGGFYE